MFSLNYDHLSLEPDLQIVHADVRLEIDGEIVIEEPLCVDVGLPALLLSALEDTSPSRFSDPIVWQRMPFVCCGCGDPECRAFSFVVRHRPEEGVIEFDEVEERQNDEPRLLQSFTVDAQAYRDEVARLAREFLSYIEGRDYRPYLAHTVETVRSLLDRLTADVRKK